MADLIALLWLAACLLCSVAVALLLQRRRAYPSLVPGLPLLGNALALGIGGVSYIPPAGSA
jgi:hypothetical protein